MHSILLWLFAGSIVVGGASLARFSPSMAELGWVGELRTWLLLPVVSAVLLQLGRKRKAAEWVGSSLMVAVLLFLVLQASVAITFFWSLEPVAAQQFLVDIGFLVVAVLAGLGLSLSDPIRATEELFRVFWVASIGLLAVGAVLTGSVAGQIGEVGAGGIGLARLHGSAILAAIYFWRKSGSVGWIVPIPIQLAAMVFSGARAPIVALFGAALLLSLRSDKPQTRGARSKGGAILLVGSVLFAVFAGGWLITVFGAFRQSLFSPTVGGGEALYLADRDAIFFDALGQFIDAPIGGIGIGSYEGPFGEQYPHNIILNYVVDGGVLPLLLIGVIGVLATNRLLRTRGSETYAALCMSAYFFAGSFFAGSYYDARAMWLFLFLGLVPVWRAPGRPAIRSEFGEHPRSS